MDKYSIDQLIDNLKLKLVVDEKKGQVERCKAKIALLENDRADVQSFDIGNRRTITGVSKISKAKTEYANLKALTLQDLKDEAEGILSTSQFHQRLCAALECKVTEKTIQRLCKYENLAKSTYTVFANYLGYKTWGDYLEAKPQDRVNRILDGWNISTATISEVKDTKTIKSGERNLVRSIDIPKGMVVQVFYKTVSRYIKLMKLNDEYLFKVLESGSSVLQPGCQMTILGFYQKSHLQATNVEKLDNKGNRSYKATYISGEVIVSFTIDEE